MKAQGSKQVRCAIYTRVSTDQGLEQDFNSLDAQYDASQAYIRSQAHAGWTMVRSKYDDGGFSGGNTDRPALQRLLDDVRAGKIDVIVVYKVDRLTRSLADFAKLVELFDQHDVSFVSVTQQFNTTTSMGRLTLNVLLSFAQFEREVTSERIRDKIAASKRKGLWVGGMAPLGYDTKDRKITVNEAEAARVRDIFRSYLKLGSLNLLLADLRKRGVITKGPDLEDRDSQSAGSPSHADPSPTCCAIGSTSAKWPSRARFFPASNPQSSIKSCSMPSRPSLMSNSTITKPRAANLRRSLLGRIFDDRGNRMTPSHARKRGIKYRYYISSALVQGQAEQAGVVRRIPADEIEALIVKAVRNHLGVVNDIEDRSLIHDHVARVEVQSDKLIVELAKTKAAGPRRRGRSNVIEIPWRKTPSKRRREILIPESHAATKSPPDPIRESCHAGCIDRTRPPLARRAYCRPSN